MSETLAPAVITPGLLVYAGYHKYSQEWLHFWRCADCETLYPELAEREGRTVIRGAYCNGYLIFQCPYCGDHPHRHAFNSANWRG